jgi:hypothetical protein
MKGKGTDLATARNPVRFSRVRPMQSEMHGGDAQPYAPILTQWS